MVVGGSGWLVGGGTIGILDLGLIWTISRAFLSSTLPYTCRMICSTWCPCLSDADWCLQSDVQDYVTRSDDVIVAASLEAMGVPRWLVTGGDGDVVKNPATAHTPHLSRGSAARSMHRNYICAFESASLHPRAAALPLLPLPPVTFSARRAVTS